MKFALEHCQIMWQLRKIEEISFYDVENLFPYVCLYVWNIL